MAERLTEHEAHGGIYVKHHDYISAAEKLARYEDLEEQGRLIELPCKIGDTVWLLKLKCKHAGIKNTPWNSCNTYWDNVTHKGMWGCAGKDNEGNTICCEKKEMEQYIEPSEYSLLLYTPKILMGKNIFLTREEAEAALKGAEQ